MATNELKRGDTVYFLKPVYALGSYGAMEYQDKEIIFEVRKGELIGSSTDQFLHDRKLVLPEGLTEVKSIPTLWVERTKKEAEELCERKNRESFQYIAKRVIDLEGRVEKITKWAKAIGLNEKE